MKLQPLNDKWLSFGWNVYEIDGHNFNEIKTAMKKGRQSSGKPNLIIANTIKGKGISFMEDNNNWHYRTPNQEELKLALTELS